MLLVHRQRLSAFVARDREPSVGASTASHRAGCGVDAGALELLQDFANEVRLALERELHAEWNVHCGSVGGGDGRATRMPSLPRQSGALWQSWCRPASSSHPVGKATLRARPPCGQSVWTTCVSGCESPLARPLRRRRCRRSHRQPRVDQDTSAGAEGVAVVGRDAFPAFG